MPDFNDVVRHVILRIVVDQAGLAESLGKARAKLKELEKAEKESNNNRIKDHDRVTQSIQRQSKALEDNVALNQLHADASGKAAQGNKSAWDDATKAVQANSKAVESAAKVDRENLNAANKRRQDSLTAANKRQNDSETSAYNRQIAGATKLADAQARIADRRLAALQKLAGQQKALDDENFLRQSTQNERLLAQLEQIAQARRIASAQGDRAVAQRDTAYNQRRGTGYAADRQYIAKQDLADAAGVAALSRRNALAREGESHAANLNKLQAATNVLEQRALDIAERRYRLNEKASSQNLRFGGFGRAVRSMGALASDTAVLAGRAGITAPRRGIQEFRDYQAPRDLPTSFNLPGPQLNGLTRSTQNIRRELSLGETVASKFFNVFRRDAESSIRGVDRLHDAFKAFRASLSRGRSGDGDNLLGNALNNAIGIVDGVSNAIQGASRHLISFRTVIVAVIVALGPLAAILGAVGAAALGLASNLVALTGILYALPGLVGAAISAFGALAIVLAPISNVFSKFTAAQNQNTDSTKKAAAAANTLAKARRDAARQIEDYRLALQKLKFDEEGAALGAESAELAYRKSLVDPTATGLDRRIARHDYEGALFDQRDQQVSGRRLKEDAAEAFKKGIDGSDQVVSALTAAKDATAQYQDALKKLPPQTQKVVKAILDLKGVFDKLRDDLSESIFGPLSKDTQNFKGVLQILRDYLGPTADAIGILAKNAFDLFTNPEWKRFFSVQGKANAGVVAILGQALLDAADGFRGIVTAAQPFLEYVVGGIGKAAKHFSEFANSTGPDGKNPVTKFLEITQKRIGELLPIAGNFIKGFVGFFEALNTPAGGKEDFTTRFNRGLGGMAKSFAKLGEDAAKPNSGFRKWLDSVVPLIKDVVHFLGRAAEFFGRLFSDPDNLKEAEGLLHQIADRWLPSLAALFDKLSQSGFISKLASGIAYAFEGLQKFLDGGGLEAFKSFTGYLETAGQWFSAIVGFLSSLPGLVQTVGTVIAAVFGVALIAKFSGLISLFKGLRGLLVGLRNIRDDVRDPANATPERPARRGGTPASSTGGSTSRPRPTRQGVGVGSTGREGGSTGRRGNVRDTTPRPGFFGRLGARFRDDTGGLGSGPTGTPISRRPTGGETPAASRSRRIFNSVRASTTEAVLGDNKLTPTLRRIEAHARQIEINTRRGGGGGSATGDESRKARPTGGTGAGARPSTGRPGRLPGVVTLPGENLGTTYDPVTRKPQIRTKDGRIVDVGADLDPYGRSQTTRDQSLATKQDLPADTRAQGPKPTTETSSPARQRENARRAQVGLNPLPPDRPSTRASLPTAINSPSSIAGGPLAGPSEQTTSNTQYQKAQARKEAQARAAAGALATEQAEARQRRSVPIIPASDTPVAASPYAIDQSRTRSIGTLDNITGYPQPVAAAPTQRTRPGRPANPVGTGLPTQPVLADVTGTEPVTTSRPGKAVLADVSDTIAVGGQPIQTVPTYDQVREGPKVMGPKGRMRSPAITRNRGTSYTSFTPIDIDQVPGVRTPQTRTAGGQFAGSLPDRPILADVSDTSAATPRRPGSLDNYTVPTYEQVREGPKVMGPKGRARKPIITRNRGEVFTSFNPIDIDEVPATRPSQARDAAGRYVTKPGAPVLADVTGTAAALPRPRPSTIPLGAAPDLDVDGRGIVPGRAGFFGRLKNKFKSDEGSIPLGGDILGRDEAPASTRRRRTTRPSAGRPAGRPGRLGRRGRRGRRGIATPEPTLTPAIGDDEYEEGYEDGLAAAGGGGGFDLPDGDNDRDRRGRRGVPDDDTDEGRRNGRRGTTADGEDTDEGRSRGGRRGTLVEGEEGRGARSAARAGRGGRLGRLGARAGGGLGRVGGRLGGLGRAFTGRAGGRLLGGLGRVGGGLARGLAGGVGGLVVSGALSLGGGALIDKFVKNDDDASSLQRGLGAVANGAGIGATIGSIIPGFGTVAGGVIGGALGGAYSLFKDKNLRGFVGDKLGGAAKSVGGFVSGAAGKVSDFFGGMFGGGDKDKDGGKGGGFSLKGALGGLAVGGPIGALLGGTDIGKTVVDGLKKARTAVADFFTKTIPNAFKSGIHGIETFFTKTLPSLPKKAVDGFFYSLGRIYGFFTDTLPKAVGFFFTKVLPTAASTAWGFVTHNLWDPFVDFITVKIPNFFTETIPKWFATVNKWRIEHIVLPLRNFILVEIPKFFTETIPKWFAAAPGWFMKHVITPIGDFFTKTLPKFFTETLPNAIAALPQWIFNSLIKPVLDFFSGIKDHISDFLKGSWSWAKGLFSDAGKNFDQGKGDQTKPKMSGGLIEGVYQGVEDFLNTPTTPGEFVIRRSKVQEAGAKAFLGEFNEHGMAALYSGLSAQTAPQVMSMVPASAANLTGAVPAVVNNTVNHAPLMGDVTIHNPVREASEYSLRRQVQIAAIRHRR